MPDLRTTYLGLTLQNPLVVSASPLGADIDTLLRLEEAGAAAVVLPSLFEEQIEHDQLSVHDVLEAGSETFAEALSYFPDLAGSMTVPDTYLDHLAAAKEALSIPVFGSLNGSTPGGWVRYARELEQAGADALELNVYAVEADPAATADQVETRVLEVVRAVRSEVRIPVAVKLGPFFTAFAHLAARLVVAGADGLVLFNRFVQPDIDLETLSVAPRVQLSTRDELLLPMRWIAILHGRVPVSLAATGGIHEAEDVVKVLLAGADVAMSASALILGGPDRLRAMREGLTTWLADHEYVSVEQLKGSMSQAACPDPAAFERASYMRALVSFSRPE
jgi:dihydroorotate dehydrogenase (fumarate)